MKDKPKLYGPEVPNYAVLNAQLEQQDERASKSPRAKSRKQGQSQPDATKPK